MQETRLCVCKYLFILFRADIWLSKDNLITSWSNTMLKMRRLFLINLICTLLKKNCRLRTLSVLSPGHSDSDCLGTRHFNFKSSHVTNCNYIGVHWYFLCFVASLASRLKYCSHNIRTQVTSSLVTRSFRYSPISLRSKPQPVVL